jgi:outer membrane biogenesis lipoprotein LolB
MKVRFTLTISIIFILAGCSDHGHSHNEPADSQIPGKHETIDK